LQENTLLAKLLNMISSVRLVKNLRTMFSEEKLNENSKISSPKLFAEQTSTVELED
jgi:hypothetical protein